MCIRDSILRQQRAARAGGEAVTVGRHRGAEVGGQVGDGTPVSYTHLRAHETGLDLVCRLLLEKKNTNTRVNSNDLGCIRRQST